MVGGTIGWTACLLGLVAAPATAGRSAPGVRRIHVAGLCVSPDGGCNTAHDKGKQMATVQDNRAEQEFELTIDGVTAIAAYQLEGDTIVFTHTLVPPQLEGHGVGSRLIRGALDQARDRGLRVVAQCPFVADYIARHPEYRDLLR